MIKPSRCRTRTKDLEPLCMWGTLQGFHQPLEPKVSLLAKGPKSEANKVVGIP